MKMRKVISAFLALICICTVFCLCTLDASAAEGARTVYATTNASAKQGSYGYLYVYLDDLTDLSALNVSVYYDTEKITVKSVTNRVSSVVNDLATGDGQVNASYIFDGKGTAAKTNLFYIYYQVNSSAEIGDTYFDIVVNEAYNSSLEGMDFTGSRCSLEITEKTVTKSCQVTSSSTVSTSVGEEFELSYRLSTYQIASGSMNIQYDPELFEVVSVTNGGFLTDKIADINTALDGTIAISFVGTTYQTKYDVVKVRFKTLKNVTETSDIKLVVTDLYDKELNLYSCSGYTTKASIAFDESYTEDAPSMSVRSSYNAETGKVTATIKLEKDSMLGAGDFVLKFDTRYLTYISAEKGFSPTFFNINDKDAAEGILKFSIISLSDITDEQVILTASFDVKHYCQDKTAKFEIGGSGLTDSLVNTIPLNFVDSSVIIPLKHTAATAVEENRVEPTCIVNGSYNSVVYCSECKAELSREIKTIDKLGHDHSTEWTIDVAPTCTETGIKSHHCSRCDDKANVTTVPANGHTYGDWYVIAAPTCTGAGTDEHECTVCHHKETKTTNALGHAEGEAVVENRVEPTCTVNGSYDSVVYCSVCDVELSREKKSIDKLGHDYKTEWTTDLNPTCTTEGSKSRHCTRCDDKTNITPIPANGHSYGDWYAIKVPTCTTTGTNEHKCFVCQHTETRTVNALGHTESAAVVENLVLPNCTTNGGYDSVIYCSVCDAELSRVAQTIDKLGHDYKAEWTTDLEPTCTVAGSKSHHCTRCDDKTDITPIPANGHDFGDWYEIKAPTCTGAGTDEHKCTVCKHTETRTTNALGHTEKAAVVENRVEPTCTTNGNYDSVVYCSVCNVELSREAKSIEKLGHNYESKWTTDIDPTCTTIGSKSHHCTRCDDKANITLIPANGHSYGDWYEIKVPTCTTTGNDEHKCSVCQHTETKTIDVLGHDYSTEWTTDIAPTCTTDGSKSHHCSRCSDKANVTAIPLTGHFYGDWYTTKEPTESEQGEKRRDCSNCDHYETSAIAVLDHSHDRWDTIILEAKNPTCTLSGLTQGSKCSKCGEILIAQNYIPANGHSYGDWYEIKASTCTTTGTDERKCSVCQHTETRTVDALGHNYSEEWTTDVAPTCTTEGSKSRHCTRCDDKTDITPIPANGHTYGDWYVITAPTCTATGTDEHECSVCQHTETRTVDALGHTTSAAVVENKVDATCTVDGSYDSVVYCSVCKVELSREFKISSKLGHNYSEKWTTDLEPTCTTEGSKSRHCTRCDDKTDITSILASGHAYGEWYETKAPTCTETGTDEHECSVCHNKETRTTDALGHTNSAAIVENKVDATCTADGSYDSVVYCSVCEVELSREVKIIEKLGHNYSEEWEIDLEATCTTAGSKSRHCTRCDDKIDVTSIPAGGHSYDDWYAVTAPTCTAAGTDEHKCSVCQHTETRTVNALGHTNSAAVVENKVDATCTVDGSYDSVIYCSVCKVELSRETKSDHKLGHNYSDEWTNDVAPTCTTAGSKSHHCSRCDDKVDVTVVPENGHKYGEWYETKAPACTATGTDEHKCSVCQHTETQTTNALGHTEGSAIVENRIESTCTTYGSYDSVVYCSVCTAELSREAKTIDKLEHNYSDNWKVDIAPTCTVAGQERRECDNCDHYETRVAEALGHDNVEHQAKAPSCTEVGWDAYVSCSRCDYTTYVELPSKGGHTYGEWERIIDPTPDTAGMDRRTCSVCGGYENRDVAALGYLQAFINAVETLSENESAENTYSELYSALQLYSKLTDDEKKEANEEFLVLQAAINAYNSKAEMANTELKNATEIAFIPISASFTFLAALWFLLKKKFWIK